MAKVLLNVFVDYETLGRTVNILSEQGVTGFYCLEDRVFHRRIGKVLSSERSLKWPLRRYGTIPRGLYRLIRS